MYSCECIHILNVFKHFVSPNKVFMSLIHFIMFHCVIFNVPLLFVIIFFTAKLPYSQLVTQKNVCRESACSKDAYGENIRHIVVLKSHTRELSKNFSFFTPFN